MELLLVLVLVAVLGILGFLIRIAGQLQGVLSVLRDIRTLFLTGQAGLLDSGAIRRLAYHQHRGALSSGFFTVWEWRGGAWQLQTTLLPPGVEPGPPPEYRGSYEGEFVKKWVAGSR